jgi:hypothetical protein
MELLSNLFLWPEPNVPPQVMVALFAHQEQNRISCSVFLDWTVTVHKVFVVLSSELGLPTVHSIFLYKKRRRKQARENSC